MPPPTRTKVEQHYLIDGYNLLFALVRLTSKSGPSALEQARKELLVNLREARARQPAKVTVVFDARAVGRPESGGQRRPRGDVRVLFSNGRTADDVIEDLIREEQRPKRLTVVSDDHRLQIAAQRRGCPWLECLDFYEVFILAPAKPADPQVPESDEPYDSPEEQNYWLREFSKGEEDVEDEKF